MPSCKPEGRTVRPEFSKALCLICVTEAGRETVSSDEQPLNAKSLMVVIEDPRVTEERLAQFWKQYAGTAVQAETSADVRAAPWNIY